MVLLRGLVPVLLVWSFAATAQTPRVVADIAPIHSLAAQVMAGIGDPDLLIEQGASPHTYALRPSQARALQESDLIVWVGEALTPWLKKPLHTLGAEAEAVELLDAQGTVLREYRDDDDEDREGDHDDHDVGHAHGHVDPHAWLDPENGKVWLGIIAEKLAQVDPQNAEIYQRNALEAQAGIDDLSAELAATLAPVTSRPFVTFHDAVQYFDTRFGLNFAGALSLGSETGPSPAQVADMQSRLRTENIRCAYREPQFNDRLLIAASEGADVRIGVLDPLGGALEPGPELYARLLRDMAQSLAACGGN